MKKRLVQSSNWYPLEWTQKNFHTDNLIDNLVKIPLELTRISIMIYNFSDPEFFSVCIFIQNRIKICQKKCQNLSKKCHMYWNKHLFKVVINILLNGLKFWIKCQMCQKQKQNVFTILDNKTDRNFLTNIINVWINIWW